MSSAEVMKSSENESDQIKPATNGDANASASKKKGKRGRPKKSSGGAKKAKKGGKKSHAKSEDKKPASADEGGDAGAVENAEPAGEKKPKKPVKKVIPFWANLSDSQRALISPKKFEQPGSSAIGIIIAGIKECADSKGLASYISLKKYIKNTQPAWPKVTFKQTLRRAVQKERIKQVRNSYRILNEHAPSSPKKSATVDKKMSKSRSKKVTVVKDGPLEDLFPHIFTWVCEPKEASYGLIKKYIAKHFSHLPTDGLAFKKAMQNMVDKGQLDQITGKGASGTLQLMDGAPKTGGKYEDAVEDAIIACNEPKDASFPALRHYLSEYHTEYNIKDKPKLLMKALERAEAKGWVIRVTGKGMSGSFRLSHPYQPSPQDLWRELYNESDYVPKQRTTYYDVTSDEEESEDSEEESDDESDEDTSDADDTSSEDDSDAEVIPKSKKRGAPKARGDPVFRKTKAAPKSAKKSKKKSRR